MNHPYDHKTPGDNLLIYNMVRNRLPYIANNSGNQSILSGFTWEIMNNLEPCFQIAMATAPNNVIGEEGNYSTVQQSIIADLVAVYGLLMQIAGGYNFTLGINVTPVITSTYIKKASAGSADVEYDQFDATKGTTKYLLGDENLMNFYKKGAIAKAAAIGCIIDVTDDATLKILEIQQQARAFIPFVVVKSCGFN